MKPTLSLGLALFAGAMLWLPSAASQEVSGGGAQAATAADATESIIVIRYDPSAIFLTDLLVAPLCKTEVRIAAKGKGPAVGTLELVSLEDNLLQPKGVYLGMARVAWDPSAALDADQKESLFNGGLSQLRRALTRRLVGGQAEELDARLEALRDMVESRTEEVDVVARQMAVNAQQLQLRDEQLMMQARLEELEVEFRASRSSLMERLNRMTLLQKAVEQAKSSYGGFQIDLQRIRLQYEEGLTSQKELSKTERAAEAAAFEVSVSETNLVAEQQGVANEEARVADLQAAMKQLEARQKAIEAQASALGSGRANSAGVMGQRVDLELNLDARRSQLNDLQMEVQRINTERRTLRGVRVERW